jgi:hypothetical protein
MRLAGRPALAREDSEEQPPEADSAGRASTFSTKWLTRTHPTSHTPDIAYNRHRTQLL